MKPYLWILAAPVLAAAQVATVDLAAPTLGYVFDRQERSLRAVEGVPGAAAIGGALHLGASFEEITWAPNRRSAVGLLDGTLYRIRLDGAGGAVEPLEVPAGRVFWSPGGGTIAILRGSDVEVRPLGAGATASELRLDPEIDRVTVTDDGSLVAALTAGGELWVVNADGSRHSLGGGWADAVFARNSHRLLAANRERNAVLQFDKAESGGEGTVLIGGEGVLEGPFALALSADEGRLVVLNAGGFATWRDEAGGTLTRLELGGAAASGLWRMQGNAVFQLSRDEAGRVWLLDGDGEAPRILALERREVE